MSFGKALKPRRCRQCPKQFSPVNSFQVTCGNIQCAMAEGRKRANKARAKTLKAERKVVRQKLKAIRTPSDWMKIAQRSFNAFIRARDHGLTCIACLSPITGTVHASHYRTTAAASLHRFDESNVNAGCVKCNVYLGGNVSAMRANLIRKVGIAEVERLDNDNRTHKWTVEELQAIEAKYKALVKAAYTGDSHD